MKEGEEEWVAYGHADELEAFDSGWHAHPTHQLLYASAGTLRVEVEGSVWWLPPGRGAWIPARTSHRVGTARASLRTVYVRGDAAAGAPGEVAVFTTPGLAREMAIEAAGWGRERAGEPLARRFFALMLELFVQRWQHERWAFRLEWPASAELGRATAWAWANLASADIGGAARAAYVSERTLSRRFASELGVTWRAWVRQARLTRAMELLGEGGAVGEVADAVGFESPSAFTRAFKELTGELPSGFSR
jgi:AraC-like DNA-binding protein